MCDGRSEKAASEPKVAKVDFRNLEKVFSMHSGNLESKTGAFYPNLEAKESPFLHNGAPRLDRGAPRLDRGAPRLGRGALTHETLSGLLWFQ